MESKSEVELSWLGERERVMSACDPGKTGEEVSIAIWKDEGSKENAKGLKARTAGKLGGQDGSSKGLKS